MTSPVLLLCLVVLLSLCSNYSCAAVNCKKFVYHPKCRGVAAKRADLPAQYERARAHAPSDRDAERIKVFHPDCRGAYMKRTPRLAHHTSARRDDDGQLGESVMAVLEEAAAAAAAGRPRAPLFTLLADRPLLLARPKHPGPGADPDADLGLGLNYDYE